MAAAADRAAGAPGRPSDEARSRADRAMPGAEWSSTATLNGRTEHGRITQKMLAAQLDGAEKGYGVRTISELIREAKARSGSSFRTMADKATQAGHRVSHQYLQELAASGPKEWPRHAETIKGLAAATDTTEAAVVHAFARSFGLHVDPASVAERIPPAADKLPRGVQDAITSLVWNLTRELAETSSGRDELSAQDELHGCGMATMAPQDITRD